MANEEESAKTSSTEPTVVASSFDQQSSSPTSSKITIGDNVRQHNNDLLPSSFPEFPLPMDMDAASNIDETMSIATDASDEELFVVLDTPDGTTPFDDVFNDRLQGRVVVAEEAFETSSAAGVTCSSAIDRIFAEKVSVLTIELQSTSIASAASGLTSRLVVESATIDSQQCLNTTLGQFYSIFNMNSNNNSRANLTSGADTATNDQLGTTSIIPVHIEIESNAVTHRACLKGRIDRLAMTVNDVVLANLTAFIEDDTVVEPIIGIRLRLTNARINILDSKLSSNDTDETMMRVQLGNAIIRRGGDGTEDQSTDDDDTSLMAENARLRRELDQLRKEINDSATKLLN